MSERGKCHEWDGDAGLWFVRDEFGQSGAGMITELQYCPTCGVRLNADGTEQARCDAVTAEAVRETEFMRDLEEAMANGWSSSNGVRKDEFEIIHAALSQSRGLAVAEYARKLLSRLIDVSHEIAAEDCPYVAGPDQPILAGLRDGWFQGRHHALSVMQGAICGMLSAADAIIAAQPGEERGADEPAQ